MPGFSQAHLQGGSSMLCRNPHPTLARMAVVLAVLALVPAALEAQITSFDESGIHVVMTGLTGTSTGECAGRLTPATGALALACSHDVAGGRTLISRGRLDDGGTLAFDLGFGAIVDADLVLSEALTAALLTGELFVSVTSVAFPLGEVSAPLLVETPIGEQIMRFPLTNQDMVQTSSTATAHCALRIRAGNGPITLLCSHTIASPVAAELFIDGGMVKQAGGVASPFELNMPELRASFARFLDGDFGLRVTSNAFPQGELGRVLGDCIEGPTTLCLNDDRFRVSVQFTAPNQTPAAGRAVPASSQDSGLFWFFSPANWEVLVKVLDPCVQRSHFWVFLSANTNVAFTVTIYDTVSGLTRFYSNAQGHIADTVADTAAFPCT
jgi:hypothetical protein